MNESGFEKMIALREGRLGYGTALSDACNRSQILDVGRKKQPAVIEVNRICGIREKVQANARTHLSFRSGERCVVCIIAHSGSNLELLRGRICKLAVESSVVS